MKKTMCILLAIGLIAAMPLSVSAASNDNTMSISPFYLQIGVLSSEISIDASGNTTCRGVVRATNSSTKLAIEVSLQQFKNNSWTTLKTWTGTGPGYTSLEVSGSYYVSSGYAYRVVSTARVYDASGKLLETASKTTSEKRW